MSDDKDRVEPYVIPEEWEKARPYLERRLENRRREIDRRDADVNLKLHALSEQVMETKEELHGVRDGVQHLNNSFRQVQEQNALLVQMVSQEGVAQIARWEGYESEQRTQGNIIRDGYDLLRRDDRSRYPMRLITVILLFAILFAIIVSEVS
jgi:hypothetical protein